MDPLSATGLGITVGSSIPPVARSCTEFFETKRRTQECIKAKLSELQALKSVLETVKELPLPRQLGIECRGDIDKLHNTKEELEEMSKKYSEGSRQRTLSTLFNLDEPKLSRIESTLVNTRAWLQLHAQPIANAERDSNPSVSYHPNVPLS